MSEALKALETLEFGISDYGMPEEKSWRKLIETIRTALQAQATAASGDVENLRSIASNWYLDHEKETYDGMGMLINFVDHLHHSGLLSSAGKVEVLKEPQAVQHLRDMISSGFPSDAQLLATDPWNIIEYIDKITSQRGLLREGEQ